MSIAEFLLTVDAFACLNRATAKQLAGHIHEAKFKRGETIIRKGDPGDCMYIIAEGRVRVPIFDREGRPVYNAELEERQFFGEMALLTGEPRNANVVARTDCKCFVIPRNTLLELLERQPMVAQFLTAILGERLMRGNGIRKIGRYKLIGELGRGGTAIIFEGLHPTLERVVAIKMLSHALVYHREFAERFRNEAKIIAGLRHPHIVEVFDALEAYATFFIIMEKLMGVDLSEHLDQRGSFPPAEVREILRQTASALEYAHNKGVVHRDIKPSNIVLSDEGEVKLTDFGIAYVHQLEEELDPEKGIALGTPYYMAPEQAKAQPVDSRTDIYALGVVAFEMLSGDVPFYSENRYEILEKHVYEPMPRIRDYCPDVPPDLEEFVTRATQKSPRKRFQSCREVLDFFGGEASVNQNLRVDTVTFVYENQAEPQIRALLDEVKRKAGSIKGVLVR